MRRRSALLAALGIPLASRAAEPSWPELVKLASDYSSQSIRELEDRHRFSDHDHWDLDQDTGEVIFSKAGRPVIVTRFQFVGSLSASSRTWLWSWSNPSILPKVSSEMLRVREYGKRRGFKKLTERKWDAEESDGWEMGAVANYLLKAKGVYRPPTPRGFTFIVFTNVERVPGT